MGVGLADRGWHLVGENGPEAVYFNGGETVRNAAATRRDLSASATDPDAILRALAGVRFRIDLDNGTIWFDEQSRRRELGLGLSAQMA